jgi:hypothetical protein
MNFMTLAMVGGLAVGGYFLFFTKEGKEMMAGITEGFGDSGGGGGLDFEGLSKSSIEAGFDDPFKYMTGSKAKAWEVGSGEWERAIKRSRGKDVLKELKKQDRYIQAYLGDAYF